MSEESSKFAEVLKSYDGKKCRVFLTNSFCVVGKVKWHGNWLTVVNHKGVSCTVNCSQIVSIGEMVSREQ